MQWLKSNEKVASLKGDLNEDPAARVGDKDEMTLFDRNVVMAVRILCESAARTRIEHVNVDFNKMDDKSMT